MAAGRDILLEPDLILILNLNKKINLKIGRQEKSTDTSVSKALHHITDVVHRMKVKIKIYFL